MRVWSQINHVIWPWLEHILVSRKKTERDKDKKKKHDFAHVRKQKISYVKTIIFHLFWCQQSLDLRIEYQYLKCTSPVPRGHAALCLCVRVLEFPLCVLVQSQRRTTGRWQWPLPTLCVCVSACQVGASVSKSQVDSETQRLRLGHYKTRLRCSWHQDCDLAAVARGYIANCDSMPEGMTAVNNQ